MFAQHATLNQRQKQFDQYTNKLTCVAKKGCDARAAAVGRLDGSTAQHAVTNSQAALEYLMMIVIP
jgi:hypothetical protein